MKVDINVQILCIEKTRFRGIPYAVKDMTNAIVQRGKHSYVLSFYDYKKERGNRRYVEEYMADSLPNVTIHECNRLSWKHYIDYWKTAKQTNIDIDYEEELGLQTDVHFFPYAITLPYNLPVDKTIVMMHDIIPLVDEKTRSFSPELAFRLQNIIQYLEQRKDVEVTTISEYTKSDMINYLGIEESRIHVVPLAYDTSLFGNMRDDSVLKKYHITTPYILYLGAFEPRKGLDVLCEAFSHTKSDVKLVIAGMPEKGYEIESFIAKCEKKSSIIKTGFVSEEERTILMSMAELFVFPSCYEGFGLPILEAMACGTAVITANSSSLPEVGGDAVEYFESGNSEELAAVVDGLLEDTGRRAELEKKGKERCKMFSWEKTAEKMEHVFEKFE